MHAMWRPLLLAGAVTALGLLVLACSDGDAGPQTPVAGSPRSPLPSFPPAENFQPAGDIHAPSYQEPVQVEGGDWSVPADGLPSEILTAAGFRPFDGDEANGIRLLGNFGYREVCGGNDYWKFVKYDGMKYAHLPPGTFAMGPQSAAVCPDGSVAGFGQDFITGSSSFVLSYSVGERALRCGVAAGGKFAGEIAGRPAVVLAQDEEGYERTWIGLATDRGIIVVDVIRMPLANALKIAEGIECGVC